MWKHLISYLLHQSSAIFEGSSILFSAAPKLSLALVQPYTTKIDRDVYVQSFWSVTAWWPSRKVWHWSSPPNTNSSRGLLTSRHVNQSLAYCTVSGVGSSIVVVRAHSSQISDIDSLSWTQRLSNPLACWPTKIAIGFLYIGGQKVSVHRVHAALNDICTIGVSDTLKSCPFLILDYGLVIVEHLMFMSIHPPNCRNEVKLT